MTFIAVPALVFAAGGDLTYLQLAIGAVLARVIVGLWFVPAYYQREIYSPYDYMGARLGPSIRRLTTGLFMLSAILGQSVRVLLTAVVLQVISGIPLWQSIWIIGAVAVVWTLLGGITTVIWTDVIQFVVFLFGLLVALVFVLARLPGGWAEVWQVAAAADKLQFWNFSLAPDEAFTLWAALLGNTLLCLNAYGTDQLIAQRMFCCRGPREARNAIIFSSVGQVVTLLAAAVGLALFAFFQTNALPPEAAQMVADDNDRIFPMFLVTYIPPGLTGLIIAGVFAAAISSLDSVLAALSQTVVTGAYAPWREGRNGQAATSAAESDKHYVRAARVLVVVWAVLLCAMAQVADFAREQYQDLLNLALAMATYVGGPMLGTLLAALLPLPIKARGLCWGTPLALLTVFGITWHQEWAQFATAGAAVVIVAFWLRHIVRDWHSTEQRRSAAAETAVLLVTAGLAISLNLYVMPGTGEHLRIAWPWNVPLGLVVTLLVGWALTRAESAPTHPAQGASA